jgi:hypothetical protein
LVVYAALLLLAGASIYDIITGQEHWPISPYAMYSNVEREYTLSRLRVFGVTEDTPEREMLLLAPQHIHPFDPSRFISAFRRFERRPQNGPVFREALNDCLDRYEARRLAGRHDGPPIRALRLYRQRWKLDPRAANVNRPYTRKLIAEIERPESGARVEKP